MVVERREIGHPRRVDPSDLTTFRALVERTRELPDRAAFPSEIALPSQEWKTKKWEHYTEDDVEARLKDNISIKPKGRKVQVRDGFGKLLRKDEYQILQTPTLEEGKRGMTQTVVLTDKYVKERTSLVWQKLGEEKTKINPNTGEEETRNGLGWIKFKTQAQKDAFVKRLKDAKANKKAHAEPTVSPEPSEPEVPLVVTPQVVERRKRFEWRRHGAILGLAAALAVFIFVYGNWPSPKPAVETPQAQVAAIEATPITRIDPTVIPTVVNVSQSAPVPVNRPTQIVYQATSTPEPRPTATEKPAYVDITKSQAEDVVSKFYNEPLVIKPQESFEAAVKARLASVGITQQNQFIDVLESSSGLSTALIIDPQSAKQTQGDPEKLRELLRRPTTKQVQPIKFNEELRNLLTEALLRN